jgi:hypothetical protein
MVSIVVRDAITYNGARGRSQSSPRLCRPLSLSALHFQRLLRWHPRANPCIDDRSYLSNVYDPHRHRLPGYHFRRHRWNLRSVDHLNFQVGREARDATEQWGTMTAEYS